MQGRARAAPASEPFKALQARESFDLAVGTKDVATKRALLESESDKIFRSHEDLNS